MAYIYSNPMAEAATMGGAVGQSLGQAMYGVPMQRAEMMMKLAELQRQYQTMQQMGQYRNMMAQNATNRTNALTEHQQVMEGLRQLQLGNENSWHQMQIEEQNRRTDAMNHSTDVRANEPRALGNGYIYTPPGLGGGQQQQQSDNPLFSWLPQQQLMQHVPLMEGLQGGQQLPQMGLPQGSQSGLPPGVSQLPPQPKPQNQQLTPDAMVRLFSGLQGQYNGLNLPSQMTNSAFNGSRNTISNMLQTLAPRVQGLLQGAQPQQQQQQQSTNKVFNWDPTQGRLY